MNILLLLIKKHRDQIFMIFHKNCYYVIEIINSYQPVLLILECKLGHGLL